jgi:hypothetical protein
MRGVAAVALVLNVVAPFAESLFQRTGQGLVLAMFFHPFPGDGVPALLELGMFFGVAPTADPGFHRRFFGPRFFMTLMAGDAIHPILGVFAVDPRLKDPPGLFLVAGQAVAGLFLSVGRGSQE